MALVFLDFETRSVADIKRVGSTAYARDPSTSILCLAVAYDQETLILWRDFEICPYTDRDWLIAHNVGFEKSIIKYCLPHWIQSDRWIDTSSMCRLAGLPGALGEAASILDLSEQKDTRGKTLVRQLCKPRKPTKKDPSIWVGSPEMLAELEAYCIQDVETMRALYYYLPKISRSEYDIWQINRQMNERGIRIDRSSAENMARIVAEEKERGVEELFEITGGKINSVDQVKRIADFCGLKSIDAKSIKDNIKMLDDTSRRVLEIRQQLGKSSTAKISAILERIGDDDRIRDLLIYHGAAPGRETGTGPQPLNWPRGKIKSAEEMESAIAALNKGCDSCLSLSYGGRMSAVSSALRGLIIPEKGKRFLCADLNAIEARLVMWFAGELSALENFESYDLTGNKLLEIYRIMAGQIYTKDVKEIQESERFIGKQSILGLGYGMGYNKFRITCANYGVEVSKKLALRAVKTYRGQFQLVPKLWSDIEKRVLYCIEGKRSINFGNLLFDYETKGRKNWLIIQLPSGRKMRYFDPQIENVIIPEHEKEVLTEDDQVVQIRVPERVVKQIAYRGVEQKRFTKISTWGGSILENIVQATSRDLLWFLVAELQKSKYSPILTIYDEILCEQRGGNLEEMCEIMGRIPEYLQGLPTKASGWEGVRYRKG